MLNRFLHHVTSRLYKVKKSYMFTSSVSPWSGVEIFVSLRQTACSSVGGCTIFSEEETGCVPHENGSRILCNRMGSYIIILHWPNY
jgi:hypothetical protein